MQSATAAFLALAASAMLATPTLAKNAKVQRVETEETTPSCHSYQFGADGNWTELPCQELGTRSPSRHRAPPKPHEDEAR